MRTIYLIRDYDRLKADYIDMIESSPEPGDGQPRGSETSDPTFNLAVKCERILDSILAIESAFECIPKEYRKGIKDNIMYQTRYPDIAGSATWSRYKSKLINRVANNMGWI